MLGVKPRHQAIGLHWSASSPASEEESGPRELAAEFSSRR